MKESLDNQYQLSDYIEAAMTEYFIQPSEEWDAIIAESKENYKTLKKILDISGIFVNLSCFSLFVGKDSELLK